MEETETLIKGICLTTILVVCIFLGIFCCIDYINESSKEFNYDSYINCSNLSLEETSECLRSFIFSIYNYTVREDEPRSLNDIIENGGDCSDYNKLYENMAKELGLYGYSFRIDVNDTVAHRFAIISNEEGYCVLDQISKVKCFYYAQ